MGSKKAKILLAASEYVDIFSIKAELMLQTILCPIEVAMVWSLEVCDV